MSSGSEPTCPCPPKPRCAKPKCARKGIKTRNAFFNFLRVFRKKCCGMSITQVAVLGARKWSCMTKQEKRKYVKEACNAPRYRYRCGPPGRRPKCSPKPSGRGPGRPPKCCPMPSRPKCAPKPHHHAPMKCCPKPSPRPRCSAKPRCRPRPKSCCPKPKPRSAKPRCPCN